MNLLLIGGKVLGLVGSSYVLTTFCLWLGHWLGHASWSPLRDCHVLGHHRIYPDSARSRSAKFILSRGKHDSNRVMIPLLVVAASCEIALLPPAWASVGVGALTFWALGFAWLHAQFHLEVSILNGCSWFTRARARHDLHHDEDVNLMVGDHTWDRLLGTFKEPPSTPPLPRPKCTRFPT